MRQLGVKPAKSTAGVTAVQMEKGVDTYNNSGTLTLITHWCPPNCHPQQR